MSLESLSRELPSERDLDNYVDTLVAESDRSAALMASALLEQTLYTMLVSSLADWGDAKRASWFHGATAPFGSFAAKIMLAHAMGIIGVETERKLNIIRNIRNVFAHRSLPLDFNHPTVLAECRKLFDRAFLPGAKQPAKTRYCAACLHFAKLFIKDAFDQGGKELLTRIP